MTGASTTRAYMVSDVITVGPDMDIHRAIRVLFENGISGAPVLDDAGDLVGMLSTRDCLKVAFSAGYYRDSGGVVAEFMSPDVETIEANTDIVKVAELFLKSRFRRFPVTSNHRLVGLISRSDVLKALEDLW